MIVLIRADGSHVRGMGHITKQVVLANKLKSLGHNIVFVTRKNETTARMLKAKQIDYIEIEDDVLSDIGRLIKLYKPTVLILDILNTTSQYIKRLENHEIKIITFDNTDISAFDCDIVFNVMYYHSMEVKERFEYSALYEGYKYIIVDDVYRSISKSNNTFVSRILLTQGGADTTQKTPSLMESLLSLKDELGACFTVDVVVGPVFSEDNIVAIENIAKDNDLFCIHYRPDGLARLISNCDLAITAGGTSMWEIAACKRPMYIYVNEYFEDETARIILSLDFALYDGYLPKMDVVKNNLSQLICNKEVRDRIINKMEKYDIANGAERVVHKMYEHGVLA